MNSILDKLVERRIWRVLLAYPSLVFIWLQVVEFFINNYELDARWLTASLIASIVFFPAAILWNWRHGEIGAQPFSRPEVGTYFVFTVLAVAGASWYWYTTPAAIPEIARETAPVRSLAVMPFDNSDDEADMQFLCDGIAESLINWLSELPDVRVISKSAAFRLRDQANDTAHLARTLGVDGIIRGRLERVNEQFVISASFIDTRDDSQLWGERLVRKADDVLDLER